MRTLPVSLLLLGCSGGAQLVLKSPIQDECTSAGLKGCGQIADGATLYADGKAAEGRVKLTEGLHANDDKALQLKKFADGLALVGKIPGAGQYVAPLQPAILLVQQMATEAAARQAAQAAQAQALAAQAQAQAQAQALAAQQKLIDEQNHQPPAPVGLASTSPTSETRFWTVAGNALAKPCRFAGTPRLVCIREVIHSKKTVTDVMISAACPVDVLVSSGQGLNIDWLVYAPAGHGAEVHGASLTLGPERALTVAIAPKNEDTAIDVRCGVTTSWQDQSSSKGRDEPTADGI